MWQQTKIPTKLDDSNVQVTLIWATESRRPIYVFFNFSGPIESEMVIWHATANSLLIHSADLIISLFKFLILIHFNLLRVPRIYGSKNCWKCTSNHVEHSIKRFICRLTWVSIKRHLGNFFELDGKNEQFAWWLWRKSFISLLEMMFQGN